MSRDGFKIMDSDLHVLEPPDLWPRYVPAAYRDRAPIGLTSVTRGLGIELDGVPIADVDGVARQRHDFTTGLLQEHYEELFPGRYGEQEAQGYDTPAMLAAMDREGIDVAVLYPSRGLLLVSVPGLDPHLFAVFSRAYNDWLHDLCAGAPSRLHGAAMVPVTDVDAAVLETRRASEQYGFKAIFLSADIYDGRSWDDPHYDPLWAECERQGLVVGFHTTGTPRLRPGQAGGQFRNWMQIHTLTHAIPCIEAVVAFTAGGIAERFPRLKAAFLEANCSWAPWLLWRLDEHYELGGHIERPELTMKPSEYFLRQCYVSIEADEAPAEGYERSGLGDNLVFSTDFPHPDSKWPHAVKSALDLPVSDDLKRKFLWDNCRALYSMP